MLGAETEKKKKKKLPRAELAVLYSLVEAKSLRWSGMKNSPLEKMKEKQR